MIDCGFAYKRSPFGTVKQVFVRQKKDVFGQNTSWALVTFTTAHEARVAISNPPSRTAGPPGACVTAFSPMCLAQFTPGL